MEKSQRNQPIDVVSTGRVGIDRLEEVVSHTACTFDLYEGTVVDPTGTRVIFLCTDILRGIQGALAYEAGPAWKLVLKRCGLMWGKRMFRTLNQQAQTVANRRIDKLSVSAFLEQFEAMLNYGGWGVIEFDLEPASRHGYIKARLRHSIFADALSELNESVDYMMAGMLGGLFSEIARADLDGVEASSPLTGGDGSLFLISSASRIAELEDLQDGGYESDEFERRLCA